jgi:hypothetical protein
VEIRAFHRSIIATGEIFTLGMCIITTGEILIISGRESGIDLGGFAGRVKG